MRRSRAPLLRNQAIPWLGAVLALSLPGATALGLGMDLVEPLPTQDALQIPVVTETPLPTVPLPTSTAPLPTTTTPLPSPTLTTPAPEPAPTASPPPTPSASPTPLPSTAPTTAAPAPTTARPSPGATPAPTATAPRPSGAEPTAKDPNATAAKGAWIDTDDDGILDTWDANATTTSAGATSGSDPDANATALPAANRTAAEQTADAPAPWAAGAFLAVTAAAWAARQRPRSPSGSGGPKRDAGEVEARPGGEKCGLLPLRNEAGPRNPL